MTACTRLWGPFTRRCATWRQCVYSFILLASYNPQDVDGYNGYLSCSPSCFDGSISALPPRLSESRTIRAHCRKQFSLHDVGCDLLGSVLLFHHGVRHKDDVRVNLARKALYPMLLALHRTNYAYVSPSGLNFLHQGEDAYHEELNRELKSLVP